MTPSQDTSSQAGNTKTKVLLEMRPAFEGFAGIPQETRLLFSIIAKMPDYEVEGLLQGGQAHLNLSAGTPKKETRYFIKKTSIARRYGMYSKVITSLREKPYLSALEGVSNFFEKRLEWFVLRLGTIFKFPIKSTGSAERDSKTFFGGRFLTRPSLRQSFPPLSVRTSK